MIKTLTWFCFLQCVWTWYYEDQDPPKNCGWLSLGSVMNLYPSFPGAETVKWLCCGYVEYYNRGGGFLSKILLKVCGNRKCIQSCTKSYLHSRMWSFIFKIPSSWKSREELHLYFEKVIIRIARFWIRNILFINPCWANPHTRQP